MAIIDDNFSFPQKGANLKLKKAHCETVNAILNLSNLCFASFMIFKGFGYLDKENGFKKQDDFAPFPSGITFPLASYAQIDDDCIDSTITDFLQNISFILLGKNKHFCVSPTVCKGLSKELF